MTDLLRACRLRAVFLLATVGSSACSGSSGSGTIPAANRGKADGSGSTGPSAGSGVERPGAGGTSAGVSAVGGGGVRAAGGAGGASSVGTGETLPTGGATSSTSGGPAHAGDGAIAFGAPAGAGGAPEVVPPADLTWVDGSCNGAQDTIQFETAEFCVSLSRSSQTVAALKPKTAPSFDFTPADRLSARSGTGYFHLGDLTLRLRAGARGGWQNLSTAASRSPVTALDTSGQVLSAADLAPVLPDAPLSVTRSWVDRGGRLALRFQLTNTSASSVEIGALGVPMVFNNILTDRTLEQAHETCSFSDPYIGNDAGYVQVTRLNGHGPALLVLPESGTPLEAYAPILNAPAADSTDPAVVFTDPTPRSNTFEGFFEWLAHSKAYADNEWKGADPWNPATSVTLAPGESRSYGLVFVLSDEIRAIEDTLTREQRPVAVGIPGYILPTDLRGRLFLQYPYEVSSIHVDPVGAVEITSESPVSGQASYTLLGKTWGRARLIVTYGDGTVQSIHYYVTQPAAQAVSGLGSFLLTQAWFVEPNDYFGRSPSVMTYDREEDAIVTQSKQAWVCGLGDDGGAAWLAGAMKLFGQPDVEQVSQYEAFVDGPIWGGLQYSSGSLMYGIKRTLFYYEPAELPSGYYDRSIDWSYWGAWPRAHTEQVPRSYNYPHIVALYWTMYRLARNYQGLVEGHSWDWYLNQAYQTSVAMTTIGNDYAQYGLMNGSIFLEVLKDLEREGLTSEADDLEARMQERAERWRVQAYPFGSEMPWDSTGQEEVYQWTKYFGYADKTQVCVDAVLGYMPAVPHWGYNGCARRYWDFKYGGAKIERLERMLHHYGSSLNAIPVLCEYRDHPDDFYLLRVGYAGMMGTLSNIDESGFPSMAFHSFPDTLQWDARTGDFGLNFFGHAYGSATYLIHHPQFGWLAFGGNLSEEGGRVRLVPLDSFRRRVYVATLGLWLTLDAGQFLELEYDESTGVVRAALAPADTFTPLARLRVEQPAEVPGVGRYVASGAFETERGAYIVPLGSGETRVELSGE